MRLDAPRRLDYNPRVMGWKWAGLVSGLLVVAACAGGAAQSEAPQGEFTPPRVVAAVYSAGGPVDRVMLLFDHEVSDQGVRERIARLAELCDSKVWDLDVKRDPFVSLWQSNADREAGTESKPVVQTLVRFGMAGLTDWKRGSLAVEPFAQAFREDLPVRVQYNVGAEFPFREPAQSEFLVDGVRVQHFASPTSHLYDVTLAAGAPPPAAAPAETPGARAVRRWTAVLIGLAIAIGVTLMALVGLIAYEVRARARRGAVRLSRPDMEGTTQECPAPDASRSPGESQT